MLTIGRYDCSIGSDLRDRSRAARNDSQLPGHPAARHFLKATRFLSCRFRRQTPHRGFLTNAGNAASNGFDLSAQVAVTDRMRLAAQLEYADARYADTTLLPDGTIIDKGAAVGQVPPWSGNVWAEFDVFRSAKATVSARVEDAIRSHNPVVGGTADPATYLCNARLRFLWAGYEVAGFINNVFDSQPTLYLSSELGSTNLAYATTFRPRTFGIVGTVRF